MAPTNRAPHSLIEEAAIALARRLQETLGERNALHTDAPTLEIERMAAVINVAPQQLEQSEIVWYPHTASWTLLRKGVPLLFWPMQERVVVYLPSRKPLIAVPLDGHAEAERAIPYACALAEIVDGEVVLVHVTPRATAGLGMAAQQSVTLERLRVARSYLREARARALAQTDVAIWTKLLVGEPETTLAAFVERPGIGAVVMVTHGDTRNQRYYAGAVATRVLHTACTPTLLIPQRSVAEKTGRADHAAPLSAPR